MSPLVLVELGDGPLVSISEFKSTSSPRKGDHGLPDLLALRWFDLVGFPTRDSRSIQGHASANRFSRDWRLLKEEKDCLCGYPGDQQKAAGRYGQHDERPEMMIIRRPVQWTFSFQFWWVPWKAIHCGVSRTRRHVW